MPHAASDGMPAFLEVLRGMQSPEHWRETVEQIFGLWLHGTKLTRFVRAEIGAYGFEMWARAAHEINAAFAAAGSPLAALAGCTAL